MEIGKLVRYIHEDSMEDKLSGYYPPVGTIGKVIRKCPITGSIVVEWPQDTTFSGGGYVEETDIEDVI